jgi:hypothetical protein
MQLRNEIEQAVPFRRLMALGSGAVLIIHVVIAVAIWACGIQSGRHAATFALGAGLGVALIWVAYYALLFCLWLRRKQVEGDRRD